MYVFGADMASSLGSNRIKTIATNTERGRKRKEQIYSNKFLSHIHESRKVGLIPLMAPQFEREL